MVGDAPSMAAKNERRTRRKATSRDLACADNELVMALYLQYERERRREGRGVVDAPVTYDD